MNEAREAKIKSWISRKKKADKNINYSLINDFKKKKLIDEKFVEQLAGLSLEDVIALKLEQVNRMVAGKFFGMPIYVSLPNMAKAAAVKYAVSCSRTMSEAAAFLGITMETLLRWTKFYKFERYLAENDEEKI